MNTTLFRKLRFFALALCTLILSMNAKTVPAAEPAVGGQWNQGPTFNDYPIHMHVLPTGKLMWWPGNSLSGDDPKLFDPISQTLTELPQAGYDIFCSGHNFLPDGRLLIAGGHVDTNVGLPNATIFDYRTNTWHDQPNMNLGRWYPSNVMLPNGDVVVMAGTADLSIGANPLPQVWQHETETWRDLSTAQLQMPFYPKLFLAPNGKVFNAGPSVLTRYLDPVGTGAWEPVGERTFKQLRAYGAGVTYAPGKIMVLGGYGEFAGEVPTNTAEIIDLNQPNPQWQAIEPMHFHRRHPNVTMLPDGKVLVIGGTKGYGDDLSMENAILAPEIWDPETGHWTVLNSHAFRRVYHSNTVLLPDGRIFAAGGNFVYEPEFYSPPYLFQGPRPTISSAPESVNRGQSFFVGTPDAASIDTVTWVRLPSVTHSTDFNQGFIQSTDITQTEGGINIVAPDNPVILAGHYMMFLLSNGIPSVAKIVRLDQGTVIGNPVPSITSFSPETTTNGNPGFSLTVKGDNFVDGSVVKWNGASRPTTVVSSSELKAAIPASDIVEEGTVPITVTNPAPGGGTSAPKAYTIEPGVNLTQAGTIIAKVTAPTGGGNRDIKIIRDGIKPPVGTISGQFQYDTYDGQNTSTEDWIGYQFSSQHTFNKVIFQEGRHMPDGGWFTNLTVQVLQGGNWVNVQNLTVDPAYPGDNHGVNYETFILRFADTTGTAIRIFGPPGGPWDFISVAELEVYAKEGSAPSGNPVPTLTSLTPSSKTAGEGGFNLTVNGSGFVAGSVVKWNGANRTTTFVSPTQLTAAIPASDIASAGTAQVTVTSPAPGGGTSVPQAFTILSGSGGSQNIAGMGNIIARVTAPTGGGSKNLEIIRDGVKPVIGSTSSTQQYDTYDGSNAAADDWIGYQFSSSQTFDRVVFQEGRHFSDGGWFTNLTVQVLQGGNWVNVQNLAVTPAYPNANNGTTYETYTMQFTPASGTAIRIFGNPGGNADFISVGELEVYAQGAAPPPPSAQNLSSQGTVVARVTTPTGGGSKNLQTIRDGIKPAVGSTSSTQQYDTYDGNNTSPDDWIGYQFNSAKTFNKVVFQEGRHFGDGGWFAGLTVQVLQNGNWVNVQNLTVAPAYPNANNGTTYETYTMQFTPASGTGIRLYGDPGGNADFISVGELEVYGQ